MESTTNKNYWMMLCNPNKWFGNKNNKNAKVNDILFNLTEYSWTTGRNSFSDIKEGDLGIIKVGNDHRSIACRTLNDEVVDKLAAGIYAIIEFIEIDKTVLHNDENGISRVHFKVIRNLYKDEKIINKYNTEILLKNNFKSFSSKKIPDEIFISINEFIKDGGEPI